MENEFFLTIGLISLFQKKIQQIEVQINGKSIRDKT